MKKRDEAVQNKIRGKKSVGGNLKSLMQDLFINNAIKPPFTNILYHPSAVLIQNCLKKLFDLKTCVVIPDIPDFQTLTNLTS